MSTENNNNLRETLSVLDKVFIPEDLDANVKLEELMGYQHYMVKCWRTIPKNYSLVTKNIFTQEVKNVDGYGIKFIPPMVVKTILVSNHTGIKKYNDVEAFSDDGIALKIDYSITMRISDPAKYTVEGKNQNKNLDSTVKRLMLGFISSMGFERVVTGACPINIFDLNNELTDFSDQYGIKVERILIEKVTLPEVLRKLYNDKAEEAQKKQAQAIRLAADIEKANAESTIAGIKAKTEANKIAIVEKANADAIANKLAQVAKSLKAEGLSEEQTSIAIRTYLMAQNENAVIYLGDNGEAQKIAAGISGGRSRSKSKQTNSKQTNNE